MGFISFNEDWYRGRLAYYENKTLTDRDVYEVRQLLKVLDDLTDEGYTGLNRRMEADFSCLTRLRTLIGNAGACPFPVGQAGLPETEYLSQEHELVRYLDGLTDAAAKTEPAEEPFLGEIDAFSRSIAREKGTAYVFLLRDTLLPYLRFRTEGCESLYPWLLSRRSLADISGKEGVDDDIRFPVFDALEAGCTGFDAFTAYTGERIREVLYTQSALKKNLTALLGTVKEERITVVESGYIGTVPLLLKALDERVTFRLYTAAPYLFETYKDILFCRRYENIRKFETLYSQDRLLQYAAFRDGHFYVREASDPLVREKALAEIRYFTGGAAERSQYREK